MSFTQALKAKVVCLGHTLRTVHDHDVDDRMLFPVSNIANNLSKVLRNASSLSLYRFVFWQGHVVAEDLESPPIFARAIFSAP